MITDHRIYRYLTRHPSLPGLIYLGLVGVLCLTTVFVLLDIVEQYDARNGAIETLARLEAHSQIAATEPNGFLGARPPGSPFLEGQSITLASAALLQQVTSAVTRAGGNMLSSEVEPQGPQPKGGYLRAIANFELEQNALHQLLYEIEAGMPFLYIDQLSVHAPAPPNEEGRMRVLLAVSGLWREEK